MKQAIPIQQQTLFIFLRQIFYILIMLDLTSSFKIPITIR